MCVGNVCPRGQTNYLSPGGQTKSDGHTDPYSTFYVQITSKKTIIVLPRQMQNNILSSIILDKYELSLSKSQSTIKTSLVNNSCHQKSVLRSDIKTANLGSFINFPWIQTDTRWQFLTMQKCWQFLDFKLEIFSKTQLVVNKLPTFKFLDASASQ